ncbi:hypothetical protein FA13DRAFT_1628157, partial [Coprinellus micaceus]
MNKAEPAPSTFDVPRRLLNDTLVDIMGEVTEDATRDLLFSAPFTEEEVEAAKLRLRGRGGSATGGDGIGYGTVLEMDNGDILELCNRYRTIGLKSCMLKFMTQLITARLVQFADTEKLLPLSQNGFRAGYRTSNNMFILDTARRRAKADGTPLYVAYVNMSNTFPSTDQSTLWLKLRKWGAGGPIFD